MRAIRLVVVLALTGATFVIAALMISAAARPEPGPCNDTRNVNVQQSPSCAAPEAPSWLVLGGAFGAGAVVLATGWRVCGG